MWGDYTLRVTNKMLSNNYLRDMNTNLENMQTLQKQLASGKKFSKPSDDPFNVARSMQLNTQINANTQYNKNITNVVNWLDTTDTALGQVGNVFQSIREKLVSAGNAAYSSDERSSIKDEINEKVGQLSQILNTSFDGEYIFGGTQGSSKPIKTIEDASGNNKIVYSDKNGNELKMLEPVQIDEKTASSLSTITFNVTKEGETTPQSYKIELEQLADDATISDVISNINDAINSYTDDNGETFPLKDQIRISESDNGEIEFTSLSEDAITISDADVTNSSDISDIKGKELANFQLDTLAASRQTEISQGVTIQYNVSVSDIMEFGDSNLSDLLNKIVNHLSGKIETKDSDGNLLKDSNGNIIYEDNEAKATKALTNDDLTALDSAISNLLKVRSEVGAKQNRMESAQEQNEQTNLDLTEILSKTEDIDITEKTMEYATMQTVYLAALQTSAKIIQPTLMDYM